ncbi:MAG: hypothetical protein WAQ27_06035 [Candidatus Microsaccharimonas sp.]
MEQRNTFYSAPFEYDQQPVFVPPTPEHIRRALAKIANRPKTQESDWRVSALCSVADPEIFDEKIKRSREQNDTAVHVLFRNNV